MSKFNETEWLGKAKDYLALKIKPYEAPPCIFSISKALLKEYADAYVPQIISIGPYHFGKEHLTGMERFKSDAARRELIRIQIATGNSEFKFEQVIDKIGRKEEEIKRCYDKGTQFKGEVLLWMVARDACFILEFFRNRLCGVQEDNDDEEDDDKSFRNDFEFPPKLHPIFGHKSENPGVKSEIMKDLIKLDNQIPLFILEDILAMEMMGSLDSAKAKLDKLLRTMFEKIYYRPFEFCEKGKSRRRSHILDIYHHSCLGVVTSENEKEKENELKLNVYCSCFAGSNGGRCSCSERPLQQLGKLPKHNERETPRTPPSAVGGGCEKITISQPACKSIKETRENLSSCYKTRRSILYRSLWNEFWKAYGSKPWLVVGGFGATLVLCLTAIQVFCLFKHCGA